MLSNLKKIIREGKEKGVYLFKPSGNESFDISEVVEREIKNITPIWLLQKF